LGKYWEYDGNITGMIMEHEASRIYLFGDISHDLLVGGLNPSEKH